MKIFISLGLIAMGCLYILGTFLGTSRNWSFFIDPGKSSFFGAFLFGLAGRKALINYNYCCGALLVLSGIGSLFLV